MNSDLKVVFTDEDCLDLLFGLIVRHQTRENRVHWLRREPVSRLSSVPDIFLQDPYRLKRINLYYGDDTTEKATQLSLGDDVRRRKDYIILEHPYVSHIGALAATFASLNYYSRNGRKSIVILPLEEKYMKTASLFTDNLFSMTSDGSIESLID